MTRSSLLSVTAHVLAFGPTASFAASADDRGEDSESDDKLVVSGNRADTSRTDSVVATQVIGRELIETLFNPLTQLAVKNGTMENP